jgi:glycosyltransferase involved in cell wall biosynthesis
VCLVTQELSDDELGGLHLRGDCFVSLCHGEGWGLGSFDAAAHGKPVVTTGFGGQLDYLHGSPLLVDYEPVPVHDGTRWGTYTPDQRWAEPDIEHAAEPAQAMTIAPGALLRARRDARSRPS